MNKSIVILGLCLAICGVTFSQTPHPHNILITSSTADAIIKGSYNPNTYTAGADFASADRIVCAINSQVSSDTIHHYLDELATFYNRNTYADTISNNTGIGAARRWVYHKFQEYSSANSNRLIPSYVQFDMDTTELCGAGRLKDIMAVLPGTDTSDKSIVIIEGHIDSRCKEVCDSLCLAQGEEDNGSGTVLVMELARVMSQFAFNHTIVFMITVGEEQGLYGAYAMADYCAQNNIEIKVVQNNDIVGGIYCGKTSSPPSCPFEGDIDSTNLRIFSYGGVFSPHKAYARYIKMTYQEKLLPIVNVPMTVHVMNPEDRTGRGGDHIPFRENGFTAVRFTSANENGDANVEDTSYHDRQHTSDDILGLDTDNDQVLDSFFVDFHYLARNTVINGVSAAMAAISPRTPDFTLTDDGFYVNLTISDSMHYNHYRICVRSTQPDFDVVYTLNDTNFMRIPNLDQGTLYRISVAAVNDDGVMSFFAHEQSLNPLNGTIGTADTVQYSTIDCNALSTKEIPVSTSSELISMNNFPNPFDGKTTISIHVHNKAYPQKGVLEVVDVNGNIIGQSAHQLSSDETRILFDGTKLPAGIYECLLIGDHTLLASTRMIITH